MRPLSSACTLFYHMLSNFSPLPVTIRKSDRRQVSIVVLVFDCALPPLPLSRFFQPKPRCLRCRQKSTAVVAAQAGFRPSRLGVSREFGALFINFSNHRAKSLFPGLFQRSLLDFMRHRWEPFFPAARDFSPSWRRALFFFFSLSPSGSRSP